MILRTVDYFDAFQCIAGDCKDTCCVGWELDIDEASFEKYKRVRGKFGEKLRSFMVEGREENGECNTFRLKGNRCPFLNEKNLCELYIELGKASLCTVCREYPRFKLDYGNKREKGLSLSCEVVGALVFSRDDKVGFEEKEIFDEETTEDGEIYYSKEIERMREVCLNVLQDRKRAVKDRIYSFFSYLEKAQRCLNQEEFSDLEWHEEEEEGNFTGSRIDLKVFYEEVLFLLRGLEVLGNEWETVYQELEDFFSDEENSKWKESILEGEKTEIWYEQLMVYLVFRYMMKAVYDADVLSKGKFILFSFIVILMMMRLKVRKQGKFEIEDMIDVARIYSKEVEHSEENIAYLMEEFLFSEEFSENKIKAWIDQI